MVMMMTTMMMIIQYDIVWGSYVGVCDCRLCGVWVCICGRRVGIMHDVRVVVMVVCAHVSDFQYVIVIFSRTGRRSENQQCQQNCILKAKVWRIALYIRT